MSQRADDPLLRYLKPASLKDEDTHAFAMLPDRSMLLFVADGHGGRRCAQLAAETFPAAFETTYNANPEPVNALAAAAEKAADETRALESGAVYTAVWVAPAHDWLAYAQLGDTVAVWRDAQGRMERTPDHNVRANPRERRAAEARGGIYSGGFMLGPDRLYGIQPGRALGDREMGAVAAKDPEIAARAVSGRWILASTDGILVPVQGDDRAEWELLEALLAALERDGALDEAIHGTCGSHFVDDVTVLALPTTGAAA